MAYPSMTSSHHTMEHSSKSHKHGRDKHDRTSSRSEFPHSRPRKRPRFEDPAPVVLPLNASPLRKRDFEQYKNLFSSYLDIQKSLFLEDLTEDEARGRWKSFVKKWNSASLSEGWYDPAMKIKADEASQSIAVDKRRPSRSRSKEPKSRQERYNDQPEEVSSEDEVLGPRLPSSYPRKSGRGPGPSIPSKQDLSIRDEDRAEAEALAREDLAYERKLEGRNQKDALEELAPRADAGSHERRLEKRQELTSKLRSFADDKTGDAEVGDKDLLGGEDDSVEAFKKRKQAAESKRSERATRKQEILQARAEEREDRLREHREKESRTIEMLKDLARKQFG